MAEPKQKRTEEQRQGYDRENSGRTVVEVRYASGERRTLDDPSLVDDFKAGVPKANNRVKSLIPKDKI